MPGSLPLEAAQVFHIGLGDIRGIGRRGFHRDMVETVGKIQAIGWIKLEHHDLVFQRRATLETRRGGLRDQRV